MEVCIQVYVCLANGQIDEASSCTWQHQSCASRCPFHCQPHQRSIDPTGFSVPRYCCVNGYFSHPLAIAVWQLAGVDDKPLENIPSLVARITCANLCKHFYLDVMLFTDMNMQMTSI